MTSGIDCIDCGSPVRSTSRFGGPVRCDEHRLFRPNIVPGLSVAAWERKMAAFGHRCAYCGVQHGSPRRPHGDPRFVEFLTVDHLIPRSRGGSHDPDNLVPACSACNCEKGDMLLLEWVAFRTGIASRKAFGYLRRADHARRVASSA